MDEFIIPNDGESDYDEDIDIAEDQTGQDATEEEEFDAAQVRSSLSVDQENSFPLQLTSAIASWRRLLLAAYWV